MSQLDIAVIDVEHADVPTKSGKGTYGQLTVTYKNERDGKIDGKKLFSFSNKDVYERLKVAGKGDRFAVTSAKNEKGFWEWVDIATQTGAPSAVATSAPAATSATGRGGPQYETADERAKRQVYIIKQSSIASAVELLKDKGAGPEDVIKCAQVFVDYVLGERVQDLDDDIPF